MPKNTFGAETFRLKLTEGSFTIKVFSEIVIANDEASFFVKALLVQLAVIAGNRKLNVSHCSVLTLPQCHCCSKPAVSGHFIFG